MQVRRVPKKLMSKIKYGLENNGSEPSQNDIDTRLITLTNLTLQCSEPSQNDIDTRRKVS